MDIPNPRYKELAGKDQKPLLPENDVTEVKEPHTVHSVELEDYLYEVSRGWFGDRLAKKWFYVDGAVLFSKSKPQGAVQGNWHLERIMVTATTDLIDESKGMYIFTLMMMLKTMMIRIV